MLGIKNVLFNQKLTRHRENLFYLAYSWCNDHDVAQDLTQEALEKALKKRSQLLNPDALKSWLASIMANCWKDHLRRKKKFEDFDSFEFISDITPEHNAIQDEINQKVRQSINLLPDKQRMVITLVDIFDLQYDEVAEILEIPNGTVMSRLSRARATLRDTLIEHKEGTTTFATDTFSKKNWRTKK